MKHEVDWNLDIINAFITYGNLIPAQIELVKMRTSDYSEKEICYKLKLSPATYHRKVNKLKEIYDSAQKSHPELIPPRKNLNCKKFDFFSKENAIDMIEHIDFSEFKIEMKIVKLKK